MALGVPLKGEYVGGDPIQEVSVVGDHDGAAREVEQGLLERTKGLNVQIVGGLAGEVADPGGASEIWENERGG